MQAERTTWNDERLDALATGVRDIRREVTVGFDRVDDRFERLETKVDDRFDHLERRIEGRFGSLDESMDRRFDKLLFGMLYTMGATTVAIVGVAFAVN